MIIIEEEFGELCKLLSATTCPEKKGSDDEYFDMDECERIIQKGYVNCWDCLAKTAQIDLKFGELKRRSYNK